MIISTGDTHIHPNAWNSLPGVRGDSYASFTQIVTHASDINAEALILAGDVFDTSPPPDAVSLFLACVQSLKDKHIPILAIQGQHGRNRILPWTSIDPYVINVHEQLYELKSGLKVYGLDNLPPEELKEKLSNLPKTDILVLHQLCKGTVNERDGQQSWDLDPEWVPPFVKLVLLGDYHAPWEKTLVRGNNTTRFVYCGSTCMQSINETPDKSFLSINPDLSFTRIPLVTRPFVQHVFLNDSQLEAALPAIQNIKPESLVYVRYNADLKAVEERLRAANPLVHFYFKLLPLEFVDVNPAEYKEGTTVSLEGCLDLIVKRDQDPSLHSFLLEMLKTKNPKETLDSYKSRFFSRTPCAS